MALADGELDSPEVRKELKDTFSSMGMDIDMLLTTLQGDPDPKTRELCELLSKIVDPASSPSPTPSKGGASEGDALSDLLG